MSLLCLTMTEGSQVVPGIKKSYATSGTEVFAFWFGIINAGFCLTFTTDLVGVYSLPTHLILR